MKKSILFSVAAAGLAVFASASAEEVVYEIDPVHSVVLLKVKHLGLADAYGRFNEMSGTVRHNAADPAKSSIEFTVPAASIDTANEDRDKHLRGPDFFNAAEFPALTFKSTKVEKKSDDEYEVTGDFTVRGVTKPVTFVFGVGGTGPGLQGEERFGGAAEFTVKRSDFGIDYLPQALGDEVGVTVSVEGIKQ
jgi:polyisoprenoid-binding protein YceI